MQSFDVFSPFARSKTDNTAYLGKCLQKINVKEDSLEESEVDLEIKSNINLILDSNSSTSKSEHS
jgi:hypothetical protein